MSEKIVHHQALVTAIEMDYSCLEFFTQIKLSAAITIFLASNEDCIFLTTFQEFLVES